MASEADHRRMTEALALAEAGVGEVEPNPPVGALVVRDEQVVGRGYHRYYGGPHAEVEALEAAGAAAEGATLYVTLEPCSSHGKTPPCLDLVLERRVARVVIGCVDPNPRHAGAALERLRAAGVEVEVGVEEPRAESLIQRFRRHLGRLEPHVIAKWAMTLDGKIATAAHDSRWISGEASRRAVHTLRGRVDAVAVGVGTVLADDPALTARPPGPRSAVRVVFDESLRTPLTWSALRDGGPPVIVVHDAKAPAARRVALAERGVTLVGCVGEDRPSRMRAGLVALRERGVHRVLVEGGAGLLGVLLDLGAIDQCLVFVAPKLVGGAEAPSPLAGAGVRRMADALRVEEGAWERIGDDLLFRGFLASDEPSRQ